MEDYSFGEHFLLFCFVAEIRKGWIRKACGGFASTIRIVTYESDSGMEFLTTICPQTLVHHLISFCCRATQLFIMRIES